MEIVKTSDNMSDICDQWRSQGAKIGFVPTMGYLHEGHLSLIRAAKEQNDKVVVSIFVNPSQFAPNEDFAAYPRDMEADSAACKALGVDALFTPLADDMYPEGFGTYVDPTELATRLCGVTRPTHFKGVCTVVLQLFNIVTPDNAYFGQKDAQQCLIIERMIKDLHLDRKIKIMRMPIIREADGLAMSSRNVYLDEQQRAQAVVLSQALQIAQALYDQGERDSELIYDAMKAKIDESPLANIDYLKIVDTKTLIPVEQISNETLITMAVYFGKTRLIDNIILGTR